MIIFQKKKIIHFSNGDYCYILKKKKRERKIIINKTSIHNGIPGKKFFREKLCFTSMAGILQCKHRIGPHHKNPLGRFKFEHCVH